MKCLRWIIIIAIVSINHANIFSQINPDCEAIGITAPLGFTTEITPAQVFPGQSFCVQFKAENFNSLIAFQFTFSFDPTEMCYSNFSEGVALNGTGPLSFNDDQQAAGILSILWFNLAAEGISIADETVIFNICFDACGDATDCLELGFNNQLADFPSTEINYQTSLTESCTSDLVLIDGAQTTCIPIACNDLTIIDLAICNAGSNNMGSFDFSLCGGTPPYSYEVTAGAIEVKSGMINDPFGSLIGPLDGLPAMVYTLTVTDFDGTVVSMPVIIDNISPVTYDPIIVVHPLCSTSGNGEITISNIESGFPGELFDIAISNGLTFQDVTEAFVDRLSNGDYFITITDNQGCETEEMVTVFTPPLELEIQTTPASCQGSDDGYLRVVVTGGTPDSNGNYLINGIETNSLETTTPFLDPDFSNISGLYRIRVRDSIGCQLNDDIEIPVLEELIIEISNIQDNLCKGACEGSFSVIVTDPPGAYLYEVRDESGAFIMTGIRNDTLVAEGTLCAGTYSILARNFLTDCVKDTFIVISEPAEELIVSYQEPIVSCSGNDGQITLDVIGGMMPYEFLWEDAPSNNSNILDAVGNGTYNVTITDDIGCAIDTFIDVASDNLLEIEGFIETNLACDGTGMGLLDVNIINSTSTGNPTFEWTDINGSNLANTQMINFVNPGQYIIIVTTPDNNCEARDTVEVPTEFGLTLELEITHPACALARNGEVNIINIQGGEGPYTCIWEDYNVTSCNPTGLIEGMYNFSVIDVNGCVKDTFVNLIGEEVDLTFDINPRAVSCPGAMDGSVNINNFSGGTGPYQCVWQDNITSCDPNNLAPGIYNFAIIDINNCSKDTFVEIFEPTQNITFDLEIINATCGGDLGSICVSNIDGSNPPFNISWSDSSISGDKATDLAAGDYTISISDGRMCEVDTTVTIITTSTDLVIMIDATPPDCATGLDNGTISFPGFSGTCEWEDDSLNPQNCTLIGLGSGIYNVTLTDDTGCQKDTFIDLTVIEGLEIDVSNIQATSCFMGNDGQAFVEITNDPLGVGTYNFLWSNPADNSSGVNATAIQLNSGENFVIVTDGTCTTDTLKFDISEPTEILVDFNNSVITNTNCRGECSGSINLEATGGTSASGDYNYLWEDGETLQDRNDLCAGQYSITIIDDNLCEKVQIIEIMEPDTLLFQLDTMSITQLDCTGLDVASIPVIASGGCGSFSYEWTNNISTTNIATGLGAGLYGITVTDDCGCTKELEYEILATTSLIAVPLAFDDPLCPGDLTCIGIESASGGTNMNFTYSFQIGGDRMPLDSCVMVGPGIHTLVVFDSSNCSIELSVEVELPDVIDVDLGDDITFEIGQDAAELTAEVQGGQPEYSFNWISETEFMCVTDSCETISITPTNFTTFEVIVTDANGCTSRDQILIDIKADRNVYVPNVFDPSALPPNDKFIPLTGIGVEELVSFRIFDRWGNLVFEKSNLMAPTNIDDGWDGRKGNGSNSRLVPGVYVYTAVIRFIDDIEITYSGEVTLLR